MMAISAMGILGRIPVIKNTLQLPVVRSDGKTSYITPREALRIEEEIQTANENCLIDGEIKKPKRKLLESLFDLISKLFS